MIDAASVFGPDGEKIYRAPNIWGDKDKKRGEKNQSPPKVETSKSETRHAGDPDTSGE